MTTPPILLNEPSEAERSAFHREQRRAEVRDLRRACAALFAVGATEDEVDDILADQMIPADPDRDWARYALARHLRVRGEE